MKKRRIVHELNEITGEIEIKDLYEYENSDILKTGYGIYYNDMFEKMMNLGGSDIRVLSWLILNMNKQNFIKTTYKQLSKKLNLSEARVKQIMKKLKDLNFVANIGGIIYINPFYISKAKKNTGQLQFNYMPLFKDKDLTNDD